MVLQKITCAGYCFHAWDTTLAALVHVNFPLVEKVVINFAVVVKQEMTT
jgi:hypothetical protein